MHQARWKTKTMPSETGFPTSTSDVFLDQKLNKQTSHEWRKTPDTSWISFCTSCKKRQLKNKTTTRKTKLTQNSVFFSCQSKQDSRCCINLPHELTCQILTNQSIKIGRRVWPTLDHGEKSQNQLSSLPVIAGWLFASENLSLRSFENY